MAIRTEQLQQAPTAETTTPEIAKPSVLPLGTVVNRIGHDAAHRPEEFLDESVAPDGGE